MGGSVNLTYSSVMIQQSVDDNYLGRVFSLDWIGSFSATAISTLAIGALVDYFGDSEIRAVVLLFACFFAHRFDGVVVGAAMARTL